MGRRLRLVVLFGGRSAEHEVSCVTAAHVMRALDPDRYDVVPVGITPEGRWVVDAGLVARAGARDLPERCAASGEEVVPTEVVAGPGVVVFPLLHGPFGEDGTLQGLLEMAGVPYVGSGVLGSALAMDKAMAKAVLAHAGLPQARFLARRHDQVGPAAGLARDVERHLGWPVFVKPANLGSSVGVSKVADPAGLADAVEVALGYDDWVVIEEAVCGREIEVAVLGNERPEASVPGEVVPGHEFYDYADKYLDDAASYHVPAPLAPEAAAEVRALAVRAYEALRCEGMARVDFFYEEGGRGFLVNEANTIPGFTPISMYPKLWQASGVPYARLLDRLVELALERHRRRAGRVGRPRAGER
jgi:D-alanine-D-alanine ligase